MQVTTEIPTYDCAALREEAGKRLHTVKRGERKWVEERGEQVKEVKKKEKKKTLQAGLVDV